MPAATFVVGANDIEFRVGPGPYANGLCIYGDAAMPDQADERISLVSR